VRRVCGVGLRAAARQWVRAELSIARSRIAIFGASTGVGPGKKPTDVLSFSLDDSGSLGDVISLQSARRQRGKVYCRSLPAAPSAGPRESCIAEDTITGINARLARCHRPGGVSWEKRACWVIPCESSFGIEAAHVNSSAPDLDEASPQDFDSLRGALVHRSEAARVVDRAGARVIPGSEDAKRARRQQGRKRPHAVISRIRALAPALEDAVVAPRSSRQDGE